MPSEHHGIEIVIIPKTKKQHLSMHLKFTAIEFIGHEYLIWVKLWLINMEPNGKIFIILPLNQMS